MISREAPEARTPGGGLPRGDAPSRERDQPSEGPTPVFCGWGQSAWYLFWGLRRGVWAFLTLLFWSSAGSPLGRRAPPPHAAIFELFAGRDWPATQEEQMSITR